jgi:FtsP/CotA-like multicopper oxidase with cupredoxin domain
MKVNTFVPLVLLAITSFCSSAKATTTPCPRFEAGSLIQEPENLYSRQGVLEVFFSYQTRLDSDGNILYCFMNSDGQQSPTLHVRPGDHLKIHLKNQLTPLGTSQSTQSMSQMSMLVSPSNVCGAALMTSLSVNIHAHGTNVAPVCHQDEVINTIVNSGESFDYERAAGPLLVSPAYTRYRRARRSRRYGRRHHRGWS